MLPLTVDTTGVMGEQDVPGQIGLAVDDMRADGYQYALSLALVSPAPKPAPEMPARQAPIPVIEGQTTLA